MTSELSNALNPNVTRSRPRSIYPVPVPPAAPWSLPPSSSTYVPHRSELEIAISEPPIARQPLPPPQPQSNDGTLDEILRLLRYNKEEADAEKERRMAWEREQEANFLHRQSELEGQVHQIKEELAFLKSYVTAHPQSSLSAQPAHPPEHTSPYHEHTFLVHEPPLVPTALSPPQQAFPPEPPEPPSTEGSYDMGLPPTPSSSILLSTPVSHAHPHIAMPPISRTPSPGLVPSMPSPSDVVSESSSVARKRHDPPRDDSDDKNGDSSDPEATAALPNKRVNGHDKRCLTIQHAMRAHFLRMMDIKTDKLLPESHPESEPLLEDSPVRFVWEKTAKQSSHNASMKKRVLADLRTRHRRLYKYVPEKEFNNKTLDSAFDQAYTTFRQKFRAQKDDFLAMNHRRREDHKAMKARRNVRKKAKLTSRAEARKRIDTFLHPTFDGAFQIECMSSEESCDEYTEPSHPSGAHSKVQILRMRGLPWRSGRLLRFYAHLDDEEKVDRNLKSKRYQGRVKERCQGPPKDGFYLPPKGVAGWMVSQRWIRETRDAHPDLMEMLMGLVEDTPGFDWASYDLLGVESEEEAENHEHEEIPRSEISYSLAHALAPRPP